MNKLALGVIIFATTTVWAQDTSQQMQAGCGPDQAKFEVQRHAHSHPAGTPGSGKALVYVFGDSELDNAAIHIGSLITRVGVDGAWVGAYEYKSYTYFSVNPGDHRLARASSLP